VAFSKVNFTFTFTVNVSNTFIEEKKMLVMMIMMITERVAAPLLTADGAV